MMQKPTVFLPKWISNRAIMFYFVALVLANGMYLSYTLPWYYMLSGAISIVAFFYYGRQLSHKWDVDRIHSSKRFEKKLFLASFWIRLGYVVLIYVIFQNVYGNAFGFEGGDATFYDDMAREFARKFRDGNFHFYDIYHNYSGSSDISDMGYALYLGFIYWFTGDSILISRIIKCALSAFTAVLIYRLAGRNFGESVARLAGIFCMLWPNFWYYCGTSLKETEMVFMVVLYAEQADQMLRSRSFTFWKVAPILLIAGGLFFIRTPLAVVAVMALLFTITMSSTRVVSWGKRIIIGALAISLIGVTMGNRLQEEAKQLYEQVAGGQQQSNMEWRARRANGNQFAKYAGAAVFAPLIFTIPFPTMVDSPGQDVQKINHGGNFVKNALSGILILTLFYFLLTGRWREHMLPLSLMLGYVVVLVMSSFAQSERFHQPAMPFELMFAAYGVQLMLQGVPIMPGVGSRTKYKQWYIYWLVFMLLACVAWQWFKMKGRGL